MLYSSHSISIFSSEVILITQLLVENDDSLALAANILLDGGVVCIPTDTVYALATLAKDNRAISKVFRIKERDETIALPVLIGSFDQITQFTDQVTDIEKILADEFWPGALTIVVGKSDSVPANLTGSLNTVACRIPNHKLPLKLTQTIKTGITGTSANKSGFPSAVSPKEVLEQFQDSEIDLIIDGGNSKSNIPSTIIQCINSNINILREGAISKDDILRVIAKHQRFKGESNG